MDSRGSMTHVVIEGEGFAWLACARKLLKSEDVRVMLIDKNNYHQLNPFCASWRQPSWIPAMWTTCIRQSRRGHGHVDLRVWR